MFADNVVWYQHWSKSVISSSLAVMYPEAANGEDNIVCLIINIYINWIEGHPALVDVSN